MYEEIDKAYTKMVEEEEYVINTINQRFGTSLTRMDWKQCLNLIQNNYDEISNISGVDMEKIDAYKLDFESVLRTEKLPDENSTNVDISRKEKDPEKCREYIEKWWNSHNPKYNYYDGKDCTNFVSQCLVALGCNTTSKWEPHNSAWINAQAFREYCEDVKQYKLITNDNAASDITPVKAYAQLGDAISLLDKTGKAFHTIIVCGEKKSDVLYAAHSNNHIDASLQGLFSHYNGRKSIVFKTSN